MNNIFHKKYTKYKNKYHDLLDKIYGGNPDQYKWHCVTEDNKCRQSNGLCPSLTLPTSPTCWPNGHCPSPTCEKILYNTIGNQQKKRKTAEKIDELVYDTETDCKIDCVEKKGSIENIIDVIPKSFDFDAEMIKSDFIVFKADYILQESIAQHLSKNYDISTKLVNLILEQHNKTTLIVSNRVIISYVDDSIIITGLDSLIGTVLNKISEYDFVIIPLALKYQHDTHFVSSYIDVKKRSLLIFDSNIIYTFGPVQKSYYTTYLDKINIYSKAKLTLIDTADYFLNFGCPRAFQTKRNRHDCQIWNLYLSALLVLNNDVSVKKIVGLYESYTSEQYVDLLQRFLFYVYYLCKKNNLGCTQKIGDGRVIVDPKLNTSHYREKTIRYVLTIEKNLDKLICCINHRNNKNSDCKENYLACNDGGHIGELIDQINLLFDYIKNFTSSNKQRMQTFEKAIVDIYGSIDLAIGLVQKDWDFIYMVGGFVSAIIIFIKKMIKLNNTGLEQLAQLKLKSNSNMQKNLDIEKNMEKLTQYQNQLGDIMDYFNKFEIILLD